MANDTIVTIEAKRRETISKSYNNKLRAEGKMPGNLLDKGKSIPVEFDPKFLSRAWQNGKRFNMKFEGSERVVKITELQINAVKRIPLHVDLMFE
jgi:ribosomal protein L25 (general stress protein Ctc)